MLKYDLITLVAPKDFNKVEYCLYYALKYLNPQPENYYIIAPIHTEDIKVQNKIIHIVNEREVISLDPTACINFNRPQWIYQQFIKLFQNINPHDDYLVVDSDLIFNREFNIFSPKSNRQFFLGADQNHQPYFNFIKRFFKYGREYSHSFIADMMLFNKKVCKEIENIFGNYTNLYQICIDHIKNYVSQQESYVFSEYEIYGNYVYKNHNNLYEFKKIKTHVCGKERVWTNNEIEDLIKEMSTKDYDTFTYNTWE